MVDIRPDGAGDDRRTSGRILATCYPAAIVIPIEDVCDDDWAEWYQLTPQQRWARSQALWPTFLALGGSLDPEPDTHSPFFDAPTWRALPPDGRPGVRVLRRGGI
jgi:hypothetical protein